MPIPPRRIAQSSSHRSHRPTHPSSTSTSPSPTTMLTATSPPIRSSSTSTSTSTSTSPSGITIITATNAARGQGGMFIPCLAGTPKDEKNKMNLKPGNYAIRKGAGCGKIVSDWEMRDELMEAGAGKKGVPVDGRDVGVGEGEVEVVRKGVEKLSLVVSGDGVEKDDENRGMEKKVVGLAELIETSKGKNRAPRQPIAQSLGFSLILSPGHNVLALADEDDSSSPCSFPLKNSLISPQSSSTNSPSGLATTLAGVGGGIGSYAAAAAGTSTTVTNNKKTENQVEYTSTTSLKKDHTVKDKDQKHLLSTATLTPTMPGSFFSKSVISAMASTPDLSTSFGTPGTDTEEGNLMRPVEMDRDQEEQGVAAEEEEEDGWETVNKSSLLMIEKNNVNKNTKMNGTTKTTKKGDGWIGIEDDRNEEIMFFEVDMEEFDVSG